MNSWLTIESAKLIRAHYIKFLTDVVDMNYAAFEGVSMEPSIFVVTASEANAGTKVNLSRVRSAEEFPTFSHMATLRTRLQAHNRINFHTSNSSSNLVERLLETTSPLGKLFDVRTGLQAYEKGRGTPRQTAKDVADHVFDRRERENSASIRYLEGRDVQRYCLNWSGLWMQYGPWLSQPREIGIFTRPRLLLREITGKLPYALNIAFADEQFLNNKSVLNILDFNDDEVALKALLGILNSSVISYFYKQHSVKSGRTIFPKVVAKDLAIFPVPTHMEPAKTKKISELVETMLTTQQQIEESTNENDRNYYRSKATGIDDRIDDLAYEVYGLAKKEIDVIKAQMIQ